MNRVGLMKNPVLEYAWGSKTAIAQLLGSSAPSERPQAELWMGAHPKAPSLVLHENVWTPLPELLEKDPEGILGKRVAERFGSTLPFLFKLLAAEKPLSLQVHPDANLAREGFERENGQGIPLDAPHRNYRDPNHKPEMICALGPFWALKGLRSVRDILARLEKIPSAVLSRHLDALRQDPGDAGLKKFFRSLLTMSPDQRREVLSAALAQARTGGAETPEDSWMIRLHREYPDDIAPLFVALLHLIRLTPGQAMTLRSGELHTYLCGVALELMANSDNVLRGGLTYKHVDVPELLHAMHFSEQEPTILEPARVNGNQRAYAGQAEEFVLYELSLAEGDGFTSSKHRSVEIAICTEGAGRITDLSDGSSILLTKGTSVLIPAALEQYRVEGRLVLYTAAAPPAAPIEVCGTSS